MFSVNYGNFAGLQMMGIGDKTIFLAGFLISVSNQAQWISNVLQGNLLIIGNAFCFSTGTFQEICSIRIVF